MLKRAAVVASIIGMPIAPLAAQQSPAPAVPRPGDVRPLLYGFALGCTDCAPGEGARGRGSGGQAPVLSYRTFPQIIAVAPGSAAELAGIRAGDVLQSIDGLSAITDAGAQRLAHGTAGQSVRLAFARDSKPFVVSLVLGAADPGVRNGPGPKRILGGYVAIQGSARGAIKLEIWSDEPIFPTDSTGQVIMRIGTSTIVKLQVVKDSTDASGAGTGRRGGGKPADSLQLSRLPKE